MLKRSSRLWPIRKGKHACLLLSLAGILIWSGCLQKAPSKNQAAVFRLFDLFQPEDLIGKVTPEDAGWKRLEWRAQEMTPWSSPPKVGDSTPQPATTPMRAIGFRALNDVAKLKIEQDRLKGEITGPTPVLDFALKENRGGAESVKFIEVRMNVSGAKQVWLRREAGLRSMMARL